jgi:hypothetical protein
MESKYELLLPEIIDKFFLHLTTKDLQKTRLVDKKWLQLSSKAFPRQGLLFDFNIPEKTVFSLQSVDLVYDRLLKIFKKGRDPVHCEHTLYKLYCASGSINQDFIHLLDNCEHWFSNYFYEADSFFLQYQLGHACMIGNLPLVKFLVENKACTLKPLFASFAAASGELALVEYILNSKCEVITEGYSNILRQAILSGEIGVLNYITQQCNLKPTSKNFISAIHSQSLEMVKHFHKTYNCTENDIPVDMTIMVPHNITLHLSKNVEIMKYLVEQMEWIPTGNQQNISPATWLNLNAYLTGMIEYVKYVERKFPYELENNFKLFMCFAVNDVGIFTHLLTKSNIAPENLSEHIDNNSSQDLLKNALLSGNTTMCKFLIETCKIQPKDENLHLDAAESGNLEMLKYLIEEYDYKIITRVLESAGYSTNLELISFLFTYCINNALDPAHLMTSNDENIASIIIHHFVKDKLVKPYDQMLEYVFSLYQKQKSTDTTGLIKCFIQYLISHNLKPTQDMINIAKEKNDEEMVAILENKNPKCIAESELSISMNR